MITLGGAALVVAAGLAAAIGFGGTGEPRPAGDRMPPATATITRATLTQTEKVSGTLSYGAATVVSARTRAGTLTWIAPVAAVVGRGSTLYKVDERPVVLCFGATPLYRPLKPGVTGADVLLLEQNLAALGYRGFTVDSDYSTATGTAVRQWQEDLGLPRTGVVEPDGLVVSAGAVRVTAHQSAIGAAVTGPVLSYTGTSRVVRIALDVARQHLVKPGIEATVTLPDGSTVRGAVSTVGTVATRATTGQGAQQTTNTTVDVLVTVPDQAALGALDEAPVDVTLTAARRPDVLTVPVAALLALAEGGYGVQVVDGSSTRILAVRTGLFAGGRVEVSGAGVTAGLTVGVPR